MGSRATVTTAHIAVAAIFWGMPSIATAACPAPAGSGFAAAARAQYECSSSRGLKELPQGEDEFKVYLNFPSQPPTPADLPWTGMDFRANPEPYLRALLNFGIQNNSDPDIDWRIEKNARSSWCHAPWFHDARERIHGMTRERGSVLKELHPLQVTAARNWAIGFYNDIACHALGKVWQDPSFPKTKGFMFPTGSYAIKLLFTTASTREVPYLTGSKVWHAAINDDGSVVKMRLLQVDVAVRASDANSETGWVFGTFIYDAYAPGETVWEKLVPVGLMWGNDPELTSASYEESAGSPQQGWMNPVVAQKFFDLPRHNLGLHGRVNGPVDNPKAACLGCHARALDWGRAVIRGTKAYEEAKLLLPIAPNPYDEKGVQTYFRNLKPDEPFVAGTQSLDYSLQLAGGVGRFRAWVAKDYPDYASETADVPSYKFKSEDQSLKSEDLTSFLTILRRQAGATAQPADDSLFVRGEQ